jgi:hypothetical protein
LRAVDGEGHVSACWEAEKLDRQRTVVGT